jgi:adenosylcobinamide-phosphate synthase
MNRATQRSNDVPGWQLFTAFLADLVFGDPPGMPHPVRGFGVFISKGERIIRRTVRSNRALFWSGALLVVALTCGVALGTWLSLNLLQRASPALTLITSLYLAYSTLSIRGLDKAGSAVVNRLRNNDREGARSSLAMIVGRDTQNLDESEILRAVTETVAENCCDGVVAPLFYLALGGVPAALTYKAINTLDSMIGYKNDRYFYLGKFAARLDDAANYLPARLTALLVVLAAWCLGLNGRNALRITLRDAHLQPSPNSGYPEAAFAGALGVRLGGLNLYEGQPSQKSYLGEPRRMLNVDLFPQVRWLFYATSAAMLVVGLLASACLERAR